MKWTKSQKISGIAFIAIISISLLAAYIQNKKNDAKLADCSVYTVGNIDRIYTLRGFVYAEYNFRFNNRIFNIDEGINNYGLHHYRQSLFIEEIKKKRGFFLQINCDSPTVHRLIWEVKIPDTLKYVPIVGWKQRPSWAK